MRKDKDKYYSPDSVVRAKKSFGKLMWKSSFCSVSFKVLGIKGTSLDFIGRILVIITIRRQ